MYFLNVLLSVNDCMFDFIDLVKIFDLDEE